MKTTLSNLSKREMCPWTWTTVWSAEAAHCLVSRPIWNSANWKCKHWFRNRTQRANRYPAKVVHRQPVLRYQWTAMMRTATSSWDTTSATTTNKQCNRCLILPAVWPLTVSRYGWLTNAATMIKLATLWHWPTWANKPRNISKTQHGPWMVHHAPLTTKLTPCMRNWLLVILMCVISNKWAPSCRAYPIWSWAKTMRKWNLLDYWTMANIP